jgi:hypothetical protein
MTVAPTRTPGRPLPQAGSQAGADDRFHFHPRATNPELWRTTLPLVVYERCAGHKGLIATWMAIHWLIVLHAAAGRRDFGVREIAGRACVGRNELTGPTGYIQRLVDLRLLQIVGYTDHDGQFRAPRPVYHVDLATLEQESLALIPDVLRAQNVAPPPRPAPDPRQRSFLDAQGELPEGGTGREPEQPAGVPAAPQGPPPAHENGTAGRPRRNGGMPATHANGTGHPPTTATALRGMLKNGTAPTDAGRERHKTGPGMHENGTAPGAIRQDSHENGTATPPTVPALARYRDVEGENEGENEGASEFAHARVTLQEVAAQAAQVVLAALQQQGVIAAPAAAEREPAPPPPTDQPILPAGPLALWQGDRGATPARERHQLQMLAAELDGATEGFGAYWVGRAILVADRCLGERGQALSINYLRGMLRRWQREGSWGSDLEGEGGDVAAPPPRAVGGIAPAPPAAAPAALPHPAVSAYRAAFGRDPNAVQAQQIRETVSDLVTWQRVLTDWQANGWKDGAVANMLDRYRKEAGTPADDGPPVSVAVIHTYPGLDLDQRERWIRKFHAAATPAEKRAVITRLAQEHPR